MARLKWITPRSTLTISNVEEAHDTEQGKFSVFPALRVEMEPKNPADLHTCTSCPVQTHGTVRDGKIWRAQHRTGELQFKICLKDVTEDLYSPRETKPWCPLPEIMSKGTNPMWLSKLHASPSSLPPPLRMPFWFSIFVPFLRQSPHKLSTCYSNFNSFPVSWNYLGRPVLEDGRDEWQCHSSNEMWKLCGDCEL